MVADVGHGSGVTSGEAAAADQVLCVHQPAQYVTQPKVTIIPIWPCGGFLFQAGWAGPSTQFHNSNNNTADTVDYVLRALYQVLLWVVTTITPILPTV